MAAKYTIDEIKSIIAPIAKRYGVAKVSVFGSYAKGTADENSDVDLLIEKGDLRSLFTLTELIYECQDALGTPVDIVTTTARDQSFVEKISRGKVDIYARA